MTRIISTASMRQCEERNFAAGTADALELMYIAGSSCAGTVLELLQGMRRCRRIVIFSGHGNNGGDGIVMASVLTQEQSLPVVLVLAQEPEKLSVSSRYYFDRLDSRVILQTAPEVTLNSSDLIVDALLGSGCRAPMREPYRTLINTINQAPCKVFAVDMPSGLGCDVCVKADITAVIGYFKDEIFSEDGCRNCGRLRRVMLPLPLPPEFPADAPQGTDGSWFAQNTPELPYNVHKYQKGKVLIAGGSREYVQAPFLSAGAALRNGAGLVQLGVPFAPTPGSGPLSLITTCLPDRDGSLAPESFAALQKYWDKIDVVAAGPGMGRTDSAIEFVRLLLQSNKPLLLDADALYCASRMPEALAGRSGITVLTPHCGEARYLGQAFGVTLAGQSLHDCRKLAKVCNATVLLKGFRTVIASPDGEAFINTSGTPALATAGSGDVLTGVIAAEMLRHDPLTAAARGAFLHGAAGEAAEDEWGCRGVTADDLPEQIARTAAKFRDFFAENPSKNSFGVCTNQKKV